jgi:ubiquinone/menaquinone biosynthesis C-methylase UbiE
MPTDNTQQIAEWNGLQGRTWAELQQTLDVLVSPFGNAAMSTAAPRPGERVIDVGCGCGDTSIALTRLVGAAGAVLGIDVSQPMLEVARSRAVGLAQLSFIEADAAAAVLPDGVDLLYSRFGLMFFADPAAAFAHLRGALRRGGRCVFVCWRTPRDNPWAMTPLLAARQALGITPAPVDPHAPGPFAFADDVRLRSILSDAGFSEIDMQRFDAAVSLGATPRGAAGNTVQFGPVGRLVREVGTEHLPKILDAVERELAPLAAPDGNVSLNGSTWVVSASNPG